MKTLVFGSCNLDYIYRVPRIVSPGETVGVDAVRVSPGGKGLNQAIALKKAGLNVYFAGKCGADGALLRSTAEQNGVDITFFKTAEGPSGQAHIQVTRTGENAILLYRGANYEITRDMIDDTLSQFGAGDLLVLQNEVSELDYMIRAGYRRGMRVVLNPSPIDEKMRDIDYSRVWLVFINEVELAGLAAGRATDAFIADMRRTYPTCRWVITLGEKGSLYFDRDSSFRQEAVPANAVDTTCAGDTFTGFFTAALCGGADIPTALLHGAAAASVTVSRVGAAGVIPTKAEAEAVVRKMTR